MVRERLWLAFLFAIPSSASGQQPDSARLVGTARSSLNGRPLAGVMVAVPATRIFDVTDSTGSFALQGLPSGRQRVRIRYGDSLAYEQDVTLRRGRTVTLAVLLDVSAIELAPVVVEARSVRALRSLVGFYERKRLGFGRYYTAEQLEQRRGLDLRTLLLEAGIQVHCAFGECVPSLLTPSLSGGVPSGACVPALYVGGWRDVTDDVSRFRVEDLAAVEIYKRSVEVPFEFSQSFAGGCGAIAIWSRR